MQRKIGFNRINPTAKAPLLPKFRERRTLKIMLIIELIDKEIKEIIVTALELIPLRNEEIKTLRKETIIETKKRERDSATAYFK